VIAAIVEVSAIKKILGHLGLPDRPQISNIENYVEN